MSHVREASGDFCYLRRSCSSQGHLNGEEQRVGRTSPAYGRSKSEAVRIMMIRLKSVRLAIAPRKRASSVAVSSCAVVQYTPLPFVYSFVVFSKASLNRAPLK